MRAKSLKIKKTIKELPDEFDIDELLERLVFIEKVEKGLAQAKQRTQNK